jgi:hypothetical protein
VTTVTCVLGLGAEVLLGGELSVTGGLDGMVSGVVVPKGNVSADVVAVSGFGEDA